MTATTAPGPAHAVTTMSVRLRGLVTDYLRVRRSLGYKLEYTERLMYAFVDYLHAMNAQAATVEHAVGFAMAPPGASPRWQALRLSAERCFARWAHLQDPSIQVPSPRLLPAWVTLAAPYIYSDTEVAALLDATGQLHAQIRALTFHTLIALMAATGIRTGEALGLDVTDFDQQAPALTVTARCGKDPPTAVAHQRPRRPDRLPAPASEAPAGRVVSRAAAHRPRHPPQATAGASGLPCRDRPVRDHGRVLGLPTPRDCPTLHESRGERGPRPLARPKPEDLLPTQYRYQLPTGSHEFRCYFKSSLDSSPSSSSSSTRSASTIESSMSRSCDASRSRLRRRLDSPSNSIP